MKKNILIIGVITLFISFVSCQNTSDKKEVAKTETQTDLSTQKAYEDFLSDWGIKIPDNATFKELKKTADGNYKLIYSVEPFENMQDSLQSYYENMFDKLLLDKGWEKPKAGWDPHGTEYEKGDQYFKFFILISEDHNIYELAFKYAE